MAIINKPFTFEGGTPKTGEASQINANYDAVFAEFNGNISDANISATANIQQSKILSLVTDLLARVKKTGDTMSGNLHLFVAQPTVFFEDQSGGGTEFAIQSAANQLIVYVNTGSHAAPVYTRRYALRFDGLVNETDDLTTKLYVDALSQNLATILTPSIGRVYKTDGAFSTLVDSVFTSVTGLNLTMATRARWVTISVIGVMQADAQAGFINLAIDGAEVSGSFGLSVCPADNQKHNVSFTYMAQMTAGNHNFDVKIRTLAAGGTALLAADANQPAILSVIEQTV